MKTRIDRQSAVDLAVALVFAAVVALSAFLWNTSGMKGVAPAISPFLVMRPLEMREEVIADYAGVQRVYEFDLTKASGVRAGTLFVHLRHTIAVVEKDGRVVADTGETPSWHIGRTPGNYWLALPIYPEDAGKTLRVTLTPVYQSVRALEPDFLVMDRQMLLHLEVLPDEAAMLLLSCVTAAMGFFLMLLALSLGLTAQDRRRVFYLGAFSCTAGVWKLCGLSVVPLLLDWYGRQKLLWYVGATAYLLMLVLSLRLLTVIQDREHDRLGRLCCYFSAFATLVLLTLQVLGVAELHDALIAFGIAMAGLHLIALLGQKPERAALLWLLPTFAALGLDLVFFSIKGQSPIAPVFLAWVALNLFVRGFGFLRDAIRRERSCAAPKCRTSSTRSARTSSTTRSPRSACSATAIRSGQGRSSRTSITICRRTLPPSPPRSQSHSSRSWSTPRRTSTYKRRCTPQSSPWSTMRTTSPSACRR